MITEFDLQEAIAECIGERNPGANTCLKLASFYTIKDHLFPAETTPQAIPQTYSYAAEPQEQTITYSSESEFGGAVRHKNVADVMAVMDELMDTISVLYPRIYSGVMQKLADL